MTNASRAYGVAAKPGNPLTERVAGFARPVVARQCHDVFLGRLWTQRNVHSFLVHFLLVAVLAAALEQSS